MLLLSTTKKQKKTRGCLSLDFLGNAASRSRSSSCGAVVEIAAHCGRRAAQVEHDKLMMVVMVRVADRWGSLLSVVMVVVTAALSLASVDALIIIVVVILVVALLVLVTVFVAARAAVGVLVVAVLALEVRVDLLPVGLVLAAAAAARNPRLNGEVHWRGDRGNGRVASGGYEPIAVADTDAAFAVEVVDRQSGVFLLLLLFARVVGLRVRVAAATAAVAAAVTGATRR